MVGHFKACAGPRYKNRKIGAREIWNLATGGNASARRALVSEAVHLACGLAKLINAYRPDVIVLGGCVLQAAPELINGIRHVIDTCLLVREPTELAATSFGKNAHLVGAAAVWHQRFAQVPYSITVLPAGTAREPRGFSAPLEFAGSAGLTGIGSRPGQNFFWRLTKKLFGSTVRRIRQRKRRRSRFFVAKNLVQKLPAGMTETATVIPVFF
jgi:hypothetical protein